MPEWKKILRERLARLELPPELEADVVEEIAKDLEESWNEVVAAGADEQAATATVLEELGDDRQLAREIRRAKTPALAGRVSQARAAAGRNLPLGAPRSGSMLRDLMQDLRYALRVMVNTPALTAVAVFTLALGIGANSAIFTVVNGVLLEPLAYRDAGRLVMVWARNPKGIPRNQVSVPNFIDWQSRNHVFEGMAAFTGWDFTLTGGGEPERIPGVMASPNLFALLGARPAVGNDFAPGDGRRGGRQAVIISNGLWRRRFGSDPEIAGRTITLNGLPYLVSGVMPRDF